MLSYYLMGLAELEEVQAVLVKEADKRATKKTSR